MRPKRPSRNLYHAGSAIGQGGSEYLHRGSAPLLRRVPKRYYSRPRPTHYREPNLSSPAFAIPPDLTADTGTWPGNGPIRTGSDEHKRLFCKTLLDTFNPYRPAVIDWPKLEKDAQDRITGLPIWDIAVQTENRAGLYVCTYAEEVPDPLLRKAIELNGFEERRHRHVLSNLVEAYGIKLAPEPPYDRPRDPEWAFMVTGYSECIDSFFAFGLFDAAKSTGYFPPEPRRHVRTRDPGGGPPHPVLRELGRVVAPQHAAVAQALVRTQGAGGLGVPDTGAARHCGRHEPRTAGQQLHHARRRAAWRRHRRRGPDRCVPARERPAARQLRPAPQAPALRAFHGPSRAPLHGAEESAALNRRQSIPLSLADFSGTG